MKYLLTGGAGFIGTHLTKQLLEAGHQVIILDLLIDQVHNGKPFVPLNGITFIHGDVCDPTAVANAFLHNPDVIYHLAAETGTSQSMDETTRYVRTNVLGTTVLLDHLRNHSHNVKEFILASSRAVYGHGPNLEQAPPTPISVYGMTKQTQEQLVQLSCPVPYRIFRFQNVYGPGQSLSNPYTGLISIFKVRLLKHQGLEIYDHGKPTRDFIFVTDIVRALLLPTPYGSICNVGSGSSTPILDLAHLLRKLCGTDAPITVTNYHRPGDVIEIHSNVERITAHGFQCKVTLEQGLSDFVNYVRSLKTIT